MKDAAKRLTIHYIIFCTLNIKCTLAYWMCTDYALNMNPKATIPLHFYTLNSNINPKTLMDLFLTGNQR